jgi:hypothetical protein
VTRCTALWLGFIDAMLRSVQRQSASLLPAVFRALDVTAASAVNTTELHKNVTVLSSVLHQQQRNFSSRLYTSEAADNWRSIQESFTSIIVDVEDDTGIATVTINRPESLNALNSKVGFR